MLGVVHGHAYAVASTFGLMIVPHACIRDKSRFQHSRVVCSPLAQVQYPNVNWIPDIPSRPRRTVLIRILSVALSGPHKL